MNTAQQRRRNWRRHLSIGRVAIASVLIGTAITSCSYLAKDKTPGPATVTVTRGDIEKTVTAVGSLKPKDYVDVGTQVSGRVEKIPVEIGDEVRAGDLIAAIDPLIYESTVRKDRADLDDLKAQLRQQVAERALAQDQLARNQRMLTSNAVSESVVDEADAALKVADATVAATEAEIKAAQATLEGSITNLNYTKIYSPLSGTVVSQTTLEGQTVNAAQSAPVIVQVANLDVMTVWAQVAEADVSKILPGMPGYFTTLGAPEHRWEGKVRQVQPTPETENDVVLYNVLIDVANKDHSLLPQMTVQVFFVLGEASNVPLVPINALKANVHDNGTYEAQVMTRSGLQLRTVQVGLTNRSAAQIRSGLGIGEQVVVPTAATTARASAGRPPSVGPRI